MACLLRGVVIGLLFGLPVGAIGALTVQRSWSMGVKAGLLTGLGSSAADCFYACIGVFGLTVLSDFLLRWQTVLTAAGGLLILAMGLKHLFRTQETDPGQQRPVAGAKLFLTSFVIGLTNPAAILTFLFAFSYFGLSQMRGMAEGGSAGRRRVPRNVFLVELPFRPDTGGQTKRVRLSAPHRKPPVWRCALHLWRGRAPAAGAVNQEKLRKAAKS